MIKHKDTDKCFWQSSWVGTELLYVRRGMVCQSVDGGERGGVSVVTSHGDGWGETGWSQRPFTPCDFHPDL